MAPQKRFKTQQEVMKARGKLLEAATSGDPSGPVDLTESFDLQAIQFAVQYGNLPFINELLDVKVKSGAHRMSELARLLIGDDRSMVASPVFVAVKAGYTEIVHKLITFLSDWKERFTSRSKLRIHDVNKYAYWFQELVQWAARWGHMSIVKFLVPEYQRLFDDVLCAEHITAPARCLAAFHGHLDVLKMILEWDQHSTLPDVGGLTVLHLAAQSGFVGAVELLINIAKMDGTEVSDPEIFTPLHLAANAGHFEVVNFLLAAWAPSDLLSSIMARDCLGRTALHYAAREGHVHVVQALVNAHEHIALVHDYDGLLALHMAGRGGHVEVIKALNPFGGITCKAKNSLAVKRWVEREYTLVGGNNIRDQYCSRTFYPGKKWKFPRVKLFDSLFWRTEGFTPLHFAARYGYGAAVEELLKNRDADSPGDLFVALFLQDSGGFLAYEWMKVQGEGSAFVTSCVAVGVKLDVDLMKLELEKRGLSKLDVDLMKLELEKRGLSSKITREMSLSIASDVHEEKQAMEELQRAWQRGSENIEHVIRRPVLQWLLEDEQVVDAPWHELLSSTFKPYGFSALDEALQNTNFTAATHMLLHYPSANMRVDSSRIISRVNETLSNREEISKNSRLEGFLMVLVTREELTLGAGLLRWLARWAKDNDLSSLLGMIMDSSELKRGLYEDRQLYVDCANAMLVGAALIAGVAFQGWLQPPLGYSYEYQGSEYADVHESAVRAFWWFNNGSFFFAVASLIAGAKGAVPVRHAIDIVRSLEKVRRAVGVASLFLGMALVCVVGAFSAAGFAVLPPLASDVQIMRSCVNWGTSLCALALLWFSVGVFPLITETIRYVASRLKDFLLVCVFIIPYKLLVVVCIFLYGCLPDSVAETLVRWDVACSLDPVIRRVHSRIARVLGGALRKPSSL